MFQRIDHVALHVTDVTTAAAFYEETFGFKRMSQSLVAGGPKIIFIKLGDSMVELTQRDRAEAMSGFHLCLQADDFDAAVAGLRTRGLPVITEPRPISPRVAGEAPMRRAVFQGPYGERIEIRG